MVSAYDETFDPQSMIEFEFTSLTMRKISTYASIHSFLMSLVYVYPSYYLKIKT